MRMISVIDRKFLDFSLFYVSNMQFTYFLYFSNTDLRSYGSRTGAVQGLGVWRCNVQTNIVSTRFVSIVSLNLVSKNLRTIPLYDTVIDHKHN
jgi:hypothetical protein